MNRLPDPLWREASRLYRPAGRYAWHFARGKLRYDPIFDGLLGQDWWHDHEQVLDLGCGQGLFAALLLAGARGAWPAHYPARPESLRWRGIELMPQDVRRGQLAFHEQGESVRIQQGDIRSCDYGRATTVLLLDVLHYLDQQAQELVLRKVHGCLQPGGQLLVRIGHAGGGWRFALSQLIDTWVARWRGLPVTRLCGRSLPQWQALLLRLGFRVEASLNLGPNSSFVNVLLRARKVQ